MKHALIAALSVALAAPAVYIPQPADAQVLAGRGASGTRARTVTPAQRRQARLNAAEDRLAELEDKIAELTAAREAGQLTERQEQELARLTTRRDEQQRVVERLIEST